MFDMNLIQRIADTNEHLVKEIEHKN